MSRVAKNPVIIPTGVEVTINPDMITVQGPLGTLSQALNGLVSIEKQDNQLVFGLLKETNEAKLLNGQVRKLSLTLTR